MIQLYNGNPFHWRKIRETFTNLENRLTLRHPWPDNSPAFFPFSVTSRRANSTTVQKLCSEPHTGASLASPTWHPTWQLLALPRHSLLCTRSHHSTRNKLAREPPPWECKRRKKKSKNDIYSWGYMFFSGILFYFQRFSCFYLHCCRRKCFVVLWIWYFNLVVFFE